MGGKKKGVKTGKHEKWEIIKRSTQKNLQGSSYKKEDKYLNPIVYNDIDQAINWKISRPLRVINTIENSQFPLNGGTHQCCFHVIPKRGTVDELRRCRLLNKLVGVDMNFYRSVQPEGITATSIKFYFDQGNIPREFMFGRQFFCWHHLNLMFGTRPRFIDKDTDKTLGLFAVSNIPKGTLVAAFSNSKINGIPDLYYFRDLANYCTESGTANVEIKTIQISRDGKNNSLNADYCVKYVPVDDDDKYKDHEDYFDKSIYSALELTEDLTANLESPTQIFVKDIKKFKKNENDFTLSYSKNNFILKVFDESNEKKNAEIEDKSIRINRGKISLEESVDANAIANIIKKHGENLVFLYFCPKTMQCLSNNLINKDQDNDNCLTIENEPNQEILFFLGACSKKDNCITTLASIYDELVSQIDGDGDDDNDDGSGDGTDDGSGDGTDVDSQNFEANYFDKDFSAEYFDAMTPREYEYLRYIQSQGSQNTSAQISKILPTRSYINGNERVRLNEPNRAIAYFKLFQLYRKNIDFKNELANRLDQYHEKVTKQVNELKSNGIKPKEEYTEEDIKNLINNLNADPNKYFNEIVDQQYRNEKDIKKPNFLYQQTLALPMIRGVGTSGSSSGRSEVGSTRSSRGRSGKCILTDNIINVFKNKKNSCWLDSALMFLFSADSDFTFKTADYAQLQEAINSTKKYIYNGSSNENCKYAEMFGWNTKILNSILGNGYRPNGFNDSGEFIIKILDDNYIETTQNIVQLDIQDNDKEINNTYTIKNKGNSLEINKKFLYKDDVKNNFFKSITENIAKNVIYKFNKRKYKSNTKTNFYITNEPKNLIFTNQGLAAMYSTDFNQTAQINIDKKKYDISNNKFVDYPEVTEINIYNDDATETTEPTIKQKVTYNLQAILVNLDATHYVLYFKYNNDWYFYNDIGPSLEKQDYNQMKNYLGEKEHYHYLLRYIRDDEFKKIMDEQALALDERKKTITAAAPSEIENSTA
jgi:hypothetical protein